MDILSTISPRKTPQNVAADSRQTRNAAGGFTFTADDWTRLNRFLTLGVEGGTFYVGAKELAQENSELVLRLADVDPVRLVQAIVEISVSGRAPRQNQAIFALAAAASSKNVDGRRAATAAISDVCRTGTHLFLFTKYVEQFRGWGPTLVRGVGNWYLDKPVDKVAYQAVKYRHREDWTHRDLLRLGHPKATDPARRALFDWICRGEADGSELREPFEVPAIVTDFQDAQRATKRRQWVDIIDRSHGLSWEMLPDAALGEQDVWVALLAHGIPQTALIKQLPRLTRLGLASSHSIGIQIAEQLRDPERLRKGRVHPINVLVAQRTYASGVSARGDSTWTPVPRISDALHDAFYAAYGAVQPSNKRTLLALDISGSMAQGQVSGLPLSPREASAALALVTAAVEPDVRIVGFTGSNDGHWITSTALSELDISPRRRLDDAIRAVSNLPMGSTDCALPMVWALQNRIEIDQYVILTDNETWFGQIHPHQALQEYRQKMGIDARLAVVAMTAAKRTIAHPDDAGMIDISGFDAAVPNILSAFAQGKL